MLNRLRNTIMQFMAGRYGGDSLNRFLTILYLILWVLYVLMPRGWVGMVLSVLEMLLFVWLVFRMLSRNIPARQRENERFLKMWTPVRRWFSHQKDRIRDCRRWRYRRCPYCSAWLRLPIKKGRRTVTCSRCRGTFKAFFM